jgi:aminoglycoside 6-adenylyltransferase
MGRYNDVMEKLIQWARIEEDIRAVVVVGSQARAYEPADAWSDLDAILVVRSPDAYLAGTEWLGRFGQVVCSFTEGTGVGTWKERRVLYADNRDVDFVLLPPEALSSPTAGTVIAEVLSRGFTVHLDKDGLASSLPRVQQATTPPRLSWAEYENAVNDFNYHLVWARKKLLRGETWMGASCVNMYLARLLLVMMTWHAAYCREGPVDTWHGGRFLERWAARPTLRKLQDCLTHYDPADAVAKLGSLRDTYGDLARTVAESLRFRFPAEVFERTGELLKTMG